MGGMNHIQIACQMGALCRMYSSKATKFRFYKANICQKVLSLLTMELPHIIFPERLCCISGGFADTAAFCVEQATHCKNGHEGSEYLKTGQTRVSLHTHSCRVSPSVAIDSATYFFFLIGNYFENTHVFK